MTEKIKVVIVDDEQNCLSALEQLIEKNCPEINISGTANSVKQGIEVIDKVKPKLVFLDIRMPDGDGFTILNQVKERDFEVIFTTAFEEYAIKAFTFSALHYLLKPIDVDILKEAIQRFYTINENKEVINQQMEILKESMTHNHQRIMLPSMDGYDIYEIEKIIRCEADGCYTKVYIENTENPVLVSNPIGTYEKLLSDLDFCRVHNKYLVNLKHVSKFIKSYGGFLVMKDGNEVKVSERKKNHLLEKLKDMARF